MANIDLIGSYAILPVICGCYLIGFIIKNYIIKIPKRFIPLIMLFLGIIINIIITIQNKELITVMTVIAGGISGLSASGSYELITKSLGIKNIFNKETVKEEAKEEPEKIEDSDPSEPNE